MRIESKLAIIIDPPNQKPAIASSRIDEFIQRGGKGVLIGGSGAIESNIFQDTVAGIVDVATKYNSIPVWILPGHPDQIPASKGVTGVFNYIQIIGNGGNSFDLVYPQIERESILKTLLDRNITSIPTLYVLCGDPNASVSKVSDIQPLNLASTSINKRFLKDLDFWLGRGVECVYFESGSGAGQPINRDTVIQTHHLIDKLEAKVALFVSGGIRSPDHARLFAGTADYVVVGGYFERNGVTDVPAFAEALRT